MPFEFRARPAVAMHQKTFDGTQIQEFKIFSEEKEKSMNQGSFIYITVSVTATKVFQQQRTLPLPLIRNNVICPTPANTIAV